MSRKVELSLAGQFPYMEGGSHRQKVSIARQVRNRIIRQDDWRYPADIGNQGQVTAGTVATALDA